MSESRSAKLAELISPALDLAREGRLYPALILHGGSEDERRSSAVIFARVLLCEQVPGMRPCGACRHCRRVEVPNDDAEPLFHPDFAWLGRDLKTSTSAESTRDFLRAAQLSPYEARGQVFVVAEADSLSAEASDSLLKAIEEPGLKAPRNFLLLAPSRFDLAPTVRSRSLSLYLGSGGRPDDAALAAVARKLRRSAVLAATASPGAGGLFRLDLAAQLGKSAEFEDPRASAPWLLAAGVTRAAVLLENEPPLDPVLRRRLLALAEALLIASPLRLRGIPADRILEGLVAQHLA